MTDTKTSVGHAGIVTRFELLDDAQRKRCADVIAQIKTDQLEVIRLVFADQHGVLRGKTLVADAAIQAFDSGCTLTSTLLAKDTSHRTVYDVWSSGGGFGMPEMEGASDVVMIPDPATFRVLPWAHKTGWILCDLVFPDGGPVPFSTRTLAQNAVGELHSRGFDYLTGLEVECHIFKLEDPKLKPHQSGQPGEAPDVSLLAHGFQYLTESRMDELDPVLEIIRSNILQLGLPLRSIEVEFGPSQCEFTLHPAKGIGTADDMVLFRSAVKQICQRHGYHATFMCRPALPNVFSSGWHLHQCLLDSKTGDNHFMPEDKDELLSTVGRQYVAGLIEHADAACVFTTPTINGYKRYRPFTLAPDRALWGRDNRGAMLRVIGGPGNTGTRIENRVGEPTANPYLYLASQIHAGLDGIDRALTPATPADSPYTTDAPKLPGSLLDAVDALKTSEMYRRAMGDTFVDYITHIKRAEISRFMSEVTDWEQREYFSLF